MGGGCLVGRGRFETCPYVRLWGAGWLMVRVGAGIPLRSLRSASPFAERKGTVVVAPLLPGHTLRASLCLLASPYAEAKGTNGTVCERCDGLVQIWGTAQVRDKTACPNGVSAKRHWPESLPPSMMSSVPVM